MYNYQKIDIEEAKKKPRRTVYDVGINDAETKTIDKNGKNRCRVYELWRSTLRRCYGKKKRGSAQYFMCEEWERFSVFQAWVGDKCLTEYKLKLIDGYVYCPENCKLVDRY